MSLLPVASEHGHAIEETDDHKQQIEVRPDRANAKHRRSEVVVLKRFYRCFIRTTNDICTHGKTIIVVDDAMF
jgi:hypothetical protein